MKDCVFERPFEKQASPGLNFINLRILPLHFLLFHLTTGKNLGLVYSAQCCNYSCLKSEVKMLYIRLTHLHQIWDVCWCAVKEMLRLCLVVTPSVWKSVRSHLPRQSCDGLCSPPSFSLHLVACCKTTSRGQCKHRKPHLKILFKEEVLTRDMWRQICHARSGVNGRG